MDGMGRDIIVRFVVHLPLIFLHDVYTKQEIAQILAQQKQIEQGIKDNQRRERNRESE